MGLELPQRWSRPQLDEDVGEVRLHRLDAPLEVITGKRGG